jgi:hypothetical protein
MTIELIISGDYGNSITGNDSTSISGGYGYSLSGSNGTSLVGYDPGITVVISLDGLDTSEYIPGVTGVTGQIINGTIERLKDGGNAIVGVHGYAEAGNNGYAQAGDYGYATAGSYGYANSGNYGHSLIKDSYDGGNVVNGVNGVAISGNYGQSVSSDYSNSITGNYGLSVSKIYGHSISGIGGTSITGNNGVAISGVNNSGNGIIVSNHNPNKLIIRTDVSTSWNMNNPILKDGEMGFEKDTNMVKIGNGSDTWSNLPYIHGEADNLKIGDGLSSCAELQFLTSDI